MQHVAEVIASSTRQFEAEVYQNANPPAFGSWVYVEQSDGMVLFGLVSHVEISSVEPNRRPMALGLTEEQLQREMPQVAELLRTTFRAQVLAYRNGGGVLRQTLPPYPAGIHAFVSCCNGEQSRQLGAPYDYLRTLVHAPDPSVPVDDLLVAALSAIYEAHGGRHGGREELIRAGRVLSRLLNDDHERLQSILRRVR